MKKVTLLVLGTLLSAGAWAQTDAISKYFSSYWEDPDFTTVHLTQRMFKILAEIPVDEDEDEVMGVIQTLDEMRMIAADRDGSVLYNEALSRLKGKYDELMIVRDGGQQIQFLILEESNGKISELVMVGTDTEEGSKDFFLLSLTGVIDLKKVAKLSSTLHIDGMSELENLEDVDN